MNTLSLLGRTIRDFIAVSWLEVLTFIVALVATVWLGMSGINAHDDLFSAAGAFLLFLVAPLLVLYALWFAITSVVRFVKKCASITEAPPNP